MATRGAWLRGFSFGLGVMYYFDPDMGRRRRARLLDMFTAAVHRLDDAIDVGLRDAFHRLEGLWAETRAMLTHEEVSDEKLAARVRTKLGRCVSHPSLVEVSVRDGRVVLSGAVAADEVGRVLRAVQSIRGVREVENHLEGRKRPEDLPGVEVGKSSRGERMEASRTNWAPATRLVAGTIGCGLMANCWKRPTPLNVTLGTLGWGLFMRAVTNKPLQCLFRPADGRRAVEFQKTININAPLEQVYETWTQYESFPRFMSNVREVRDLGNDRSHWIVQGPAGAPVEWDVVVTRQVPNELFAWKTEPGSPVTHAGLIHFEPNEDGGTRVDIRLSYHPPGGAAGPLVASLFGADPKSQIEEDLLRMKDFLESRQAPREAVAR